MKIPSRNLVIGLGSEFRGDDAVGRIVAHRFQASIGDANRITVEDAMVEAWKDANVVVVIDAIESGCRPGTIRRIDARTQEIPSGLFHYSTHTFGIAEVIALARALEWLPAKLIIYGIEGRSFAQGSGLSPEVDAAANEVIRRLSEELSNDVPHRNYDAALDALARQHTPPDDVVRADMNQRNDG